MQVQAVGMGWARYVLILSGSDPRPKKKMA